VANELKPSELESPARQAPLATCLMQFQEYIDGDDYRVHVLGEDVLAIRIRSPDSRLSVRLAPVVERIDAHAVDL
jgi:hypothetical protein